MELQIDRYGAGYPWAGLAPLLRDADLAMANLECVLSTQGKALNKPYVIRAHPGTAQTLAAGGLDLVSLANNHALDYGDAALDETLSALSARNIGAVGAGRTADEARRPALLDLNGVRVAVLAYAGAYWQGTVDMPSSNRIAWGEPAVVADDVRAVRDKADVVVVVLHAGREYSRVPTVSQVAVAHAAVDAGADLVVGHHPHVTQTVERYGRGLIVYSLGDALFDIPLQGAMRGDLLRVQVTRDGLAQAELWPFWIDGEIQPWLLDDGHGVPRFEVIYP
jgi:poly-gamma-glutamate synthesis protein (capsule biosynthesis protein)